MRTLCCDLIRDVASCSGPCWRGRPRLVWVGLLVLGISASSSGQTKLITEGDTWKYFKGTEEPPAAWNTLDYDDSAWAEGATPIGYGTATDAAFKTVLGDMLQVAGGNPGYLSVYARKKFTVSLAEVKAVRMLMKIDDGFVAYINGVEVIRYGYAAGAAVTFDTAPGTTATDPPVWVTYAPTCDAPWPLNDGENVLAIQGGNSSLTSSDFVLDPELEVLSQVCPTDITGTYTESTNRVTLRWKKAPGITAYDSYLLYRNGDEITPGPAATAAAFTDREPIVGDNKYELIAVLCEVSCPSLTVTVKAGPATALFRRGDADGTGAVNITDAVNILAHLFQGQAAPTCMDAADTDDNGAVNITDAVYLLQALFQGGPQPPAPGTTTCGEDPAAGGDTLAECVYTAC